MFVQNRFRPLLAAAALATAATPAFAANITWTGTTSGAWDTTTGNWSGGSPTGNLYNNGTPDAVLFDDTGTNTTVLLASGLTPASVTVNNSAKNYIFQTNGFGGSGTLLKEGAGTLSLSVANTYTGGTTISAGTLQLGNVGSAGSGTITLNDANTGSSNTTLNLAVAGSYANAITVSNNGTGVSTLAYTLAGSSTSLTTGAITLNNAATITASALTGYCVFGSNISGSGPLTFGSTNNQRFILTGDASGYTGDITVGTGAALEVRGAFTSATGNDIAVTGTLLMNGGSSTFGALTGTGVVTTNALSAGVLTIGKTNTNATFSGTISNGNEGVSLAKTGTGTQELAGGNITYTGATTINNGTLQLTNATGFNSAVTFGATNFEILQLNNTTGTPWTFAKAIAGGSNTDVTIQKSGTGVVTLNSAVTGFSGGVSITGGTLLFSATTSFNAAPTVTVAGGGVFGGVTSAANHTNANVTVSSGGAIQSDTATTGQLALNSLTLGTSGTDTATIYGTLKSGFTPISVSTLNVYAGTITLSVSGSSLTTGTYNLLSYAGGGIGSATFNTGSRAYTVVNTANNIQIYYDANASIYWTGGAAGNWDTTSTNWNVSGPRTATQFMANDIVFFHDIAGTPSSTVTINGADVNPSSVTFDNTGATTYTLSGDHGISTGSITKSGSGTLTITNANTTSGAVTLGGGVVNMAQISGLGFGAIAVTGATTLNYSGASAAWVQSVDLGAGFTGTFGVTNAASTVTWSGALTDSGTFVKTGAGALEIAGANAGFTGTTTVSQGTLKLDATNGVGSGTITLNDANTGSANTTLVLNNGSTFTNAITVAGTGTGVATIQLNSGGGTTPALTSTVAINGATTVTTPNASGYIFWDGTITGSGNLTIGNTNGARLIMSDNSGAVTDTSGYTGNVTVGDGTHAVVFEPRSSFAQNDFTVNTSGTLQAFGNMSIGGLNGAGTLNCNSVGTVTLGNNGGSGTFTGTITNGSGLTLIKTGSGTQILAGANTYAGGTTVNGGTLTVAATTGSIKVGAAGVTVASGATLTVNGTLNLTTNLATISNSGTITGTGIINIGTLFDGDGTTHTYTLISGTGALSGANLTVTGFANYSSVTFDNTTGDLVFIAVPEPGTYGLIGAGALAVVALVRRRRRSLA